MTTLDRIARERAFACNGRIRTTGGCWVFELPEHYPRDGNILKGTDATGRPMFCISKKGVFCSNPEVGKDVFPESNDSPHWYVPHSVCRKCQDYCKGGTNGLKYPHCDWVRSKRGGNLGAVLETAQIYSDAVDFAESIVGRR